MKITIDCKDNTIAWLVLDAIRELEDELKDDKLACELSKVGDQIRHQLEKV